MSLRGGRVWSIAFRWVWLRVRNREGYSLLQLSMNSSAVSSPASNPSGSGVAATVNWASSLGLDPHTVARGRQQLLDQDIELGRSRRPGAGRKAGGPPR